MITFWNVQSATWILLIFGIAGAAPDSLTLEDCLRLAQGSNPRGLLASNAVTAADLAGREAAAAALPQLKYKGALEYAPAGKRFGYDPGLTNGGQIGSQIVLEQTLYDGGQRGLKRRLAEMERSRARTGQRAGRADLEFEVSQAFTETLRLQQDAALKREGAARLREYLALVERMHRGGQAGYTDVLKTRIRVSEAAAAARQAEIDLSASRMDLGDLIGRPETEEFAAKGDLDSAPPPPRALDSAGGLDGAVSRLGIETARLDVEAARNEWKPTISVSADAGLLTSFENLEQTSADRSPMLGAAVGLHVDWPLFAWGLRRIHTRQKELESENAELTSRLQSRAWRTDRRKAALRWDAAREGREALRADLAAARDNFALTQSKYAGGTALASEVLDAHKLWVDTHSALLQAEADLRNLGARSSRMEAK